MGENKYMNRPSKTKTTGYRDNSNKANNGNNADKRRFPN